MCDERQIGTNDSNKNNKDLQPTVLPVARIRLAQIRPTVRRKTFYY